MRKLILSLIIIASAFVFGQKEDINAKLQSANTAAMNAYNAKNYAGAAPKFVEIYDLLKANGKEDKTYMYYAGLSYALANNSDAAIKIYNDLINSGYTGVQTIYTAKDNKTGQVTTYDKNTWELLKKTSSKDYSDFKTEQTKSIESDLYETLTTLLLNAKKNDEALAIIEKGLAKFPNDTKLKEAQGVALYASGKTDQFMANLKELLAKNPNDATNWYNLGVLQSKNEATVNDAIEAFKKAIELKPDFANAYQNLVYTTIGDDTKAVEEINALRKTKPDEATKLIDARRARFEKALPYAENWYKVMPENIDAVSTLKNIYMVIKDQAKAAEMKAKEAELQAKSQSK